MQFLLNQRTANGQRAVDRTLKLRTSLSNCGQLTYDNYQSTYQPYNMLCSRIADMMTLLLQQGL